VPRYKIQSYEERGDIPIPKEVILVAETLKKADNGPEKNVSRYANLMVGGGFVVVSLGFAVYSWLRKGK